MTRVGTTRENAIQELSLFGKVALYTGGLKIVEEEKYRMGRIRTIYDTKMRRLHPIFLLTVIIGMVVQGVNKESLKDLKKLYVRDSIWF